MLEIYTLTFNHTFALGKAATWLTVPKSKQKEHNTTEDLNLLTFFTQSGPPCRVSKCRWLLLTVTSYSWPTKQNTLTKCWLWSVSCHL